MPKRKTTGRFDTREELEDKVNYLYYGTGCCCADIAKNCDISPSTVDNILKMTRDNKYRKNYNPMIKAQHLGV